MLVTHRNQTPRPMRGWLSHIKKNSSEKSQERTSKLSTLSKIWRQVESDDETSELSAGTAAVNLSGERKSKIRSQCVNALIVKVVGGTVGYHFLTSRLTSLWKLTGKMVCVGLGHDFFLVELFLKEDYVRILSEGLWFMGGHYLSIRCWEPNFRPSTANVTFVVWWVRFPELPIEYYEPSVLKDIGSAIGPVLRIDNHTVVKDRGDSPVCVSKLILINPLSNSLRLGDWNILSNTRE